MGQALIDSKEQDFEYLGSWTEQDRDVQTRKALAWQALNKLWTSDTRLVEGQVLQGSCRNNLVA